MFAMTLPLPAVPLRRRGWRCLAPAALALALLTPAARAQAPALVSADDPYTATVTVDATSDSVAKARTLARVDGQRRALVAIVDHLGGNADKAKSLKLGDNAVT